MRSNKLCATRVLQRMEQHRLKAAAPSSAKMFQVRQSPTLWAQPGPLPSDLPQEPEHRLLQVLSSGRERPRHGTVRTISELFTYAYSKNLHCQTVGFQVNRPRPPAFDKIPLHQRFCLYLRCCLFLSVPMLIPSTRDQGAVCGM